LAVAKSGRPTWSDVYEFAEPVRAHGLVFMDTPGYDPGVGNWPGGGRRQPDLLHHGRGSAYACAPSPSLKLSTNNALRQGEDIDINCLATSSTARRPSPRKAPRFSG
jgi:altronate hydrolase